MDEQDPGAKAPNFVANALAPRKSGAATRAREKEARAKLIATDRLVSGATIAELAQSYGVGAGTVRSALNLAERAGFYEAVEKALLERLLPKALAVYETHLDRGSLDAARDIAYGVGALKKNPAVEVSVGTSSADDINAYRVAREKALEGTGRPQ